MGKILAAQIRGRLGDPRRFTSLGAADLLGRFHVDEGLQQELHRLAHEVEISAEAQGVKQFGQGGLIKGHRGRLLRDPGLEHAEDLAMAPSRLPPSAAGSIDLQCMCPITRVSPRGCVAKR
ncbi:MAG TPA: hypothetical protein VF711_08655 [Acidimicrobiales bacterium]